MAKLESTLKNMVVVLCGISIFAAGALGLVYDLTLEPIRLAELAKQETAIRDVTPGFDNAPVKEKYTLISPEGDSLTCFPAKKDGKLTGVAIESYTKKGFHGEIKVMVGLYPDGRIFNYSVIKHAETPGLGSKMDVWFKTDKKKQDILGLDPGKDKVWVSKDGGSVDAITAATITSRAFLDAVDRAYRSYMASLNVDPDAHTSASAQKKEVSEPVQKQKQPSVSVAVPKNKEVAAPKKAVSKTIVKVEEKAEKEVDAQSAATEVYSKEEKEAPVNEK